MKLDKANITILVGSESTTISFQCAKSNITFAEATLTPQQLSSALSRLSNTECEIDVKGLNKVNKTMEHKKFEFKLPDGVSKWNNTEKVELKDVCNTAMIEQGISDEWISDHYYNSQDTYFNKDGKPYARTTIRRWV